MSGNLVACGVIVGLGIIMHKLINEDETMVLLQTGKGRDTLGYMSDCRHYMNKIMPQVHAKMAAFNAATGNYKADTQNNDITKTWIGYYTGTSEHALQEAEPYSYKLYLPATAGSQQNWTPVDGKPGWFTDGRNGQIQDAGNDNGDFDDVTWNSYNSGVYDNWYCTENVDPVTAEVTSASLIADVSNKLTYPDGTPIDPKFTDGIVPMVWRTFDSDPFTANKDSGVVWNWYNKIVGPYASEIQSGEFGFLNQWKDKYASDLTEANKVKYTNIYQKDRSAYNKNHNLLN